jgi:MerR family mercuric resistance operon transcriptional regulator
MKMKRSMTIGKLANTSGVSVETIRFYERKGILQQPERIGTFRHYSTEYVSRIHFIKRSQELGFTLKEAKELMDLRISRNAKCSDVLSKTSEKISEITKKIEDLEKMKRSLKGLINCCEDSSLPLSDCRIFECFMKRKKE